MALFGASTLGRSLAARVRASAALELVSFIDNDPALWGTCRGGVPVVCPDANAFANVDVVVVASMHARDIAQQVVAAGFGHKLVFDFDDLDAVTFRNTGLRRWTPVRPEAIRHGQGRPESTSTP